MSYDPAVISTVTQTMQALQRHVSRGSFYYVTGEVEASKALALAARFDERYSLTQTTGQRDHTRRKGQATFRFFVWPIAGQKKLRWWLLRTDAHHPLLSLEKWRDARKNRIEWLWLYELVRTPVDPKLRDKYKRPGGKKAINSQTWTWRIKRDEVDRLKASIRHWSQYQDNRLPVLIRSLFKSPGFRGIRSDVSGLYFYIKKQHEKRKRTPPYIPPTIRWVTGKKAVTLPLSTLVRRSQQCRSEWFPGNLQRDDIGSEPPQTDSDNAAKKNTRADQTKNHP